MQFTINNASLTIKQLRYGNVTANNKVALQILHFETRFSSPSAESCVASKKKMSGIPCQRTRNYPSKIKSATPQHDSPDKYFSHTFYDAKVQNERYPDFACSHVPSKRT
jgi:hypothetical protein